jgi:hypothetical protein
MGATQMSTTRFNFSLALALVAALSASPAVAQKNKNDDRDRDRYEQRDEPRFERRSERRVPPGWCRGRGNPHNTAANCRYNSRSREWERYDDRDRRWESRTTYERGSTRDVSRSSGSYDSSHRSFHATHDRQCRERAAQRPLDLRYQVQVRQECRAIHEDFHRRWGIAH